MTSVHDDRFDHRLRQTHRRALQHLSADTLQRLRRPVATASARPATRWPVGWTLASVAVLALALGWPLARVDRQPLPTAVDAAVATHTTPVGDAVAGDPLALDPEFYAWVGGTDMKETPR